MGNFSRDPDVRLADSLAKHQVGVRLQQGVPVLDADWNTLDDIRRSELEDLGARLLGNGVPLGNDGFRVIPLAGGAVGTLVLRSNTTDVGPSSLAIDLATSSAAAALGFGPANASAARLGSSPAQLTSNATEPFTLVAGTTLVVTADGQAPETVTFQAADFATIGAASGLEVAAAVNAALTRASASVGAGNDFAVRGGDGTTRGAGRIFVDGRMVLNESDLKYSEQALFANATLAALWSVDPVPPLTSSNAPQTVYLDVWHREVDSEEDGALVDVRIGVETATRLRREWVVRVTPSAGFSAVFAARPPGHSYYPLASLTRGGIGALVDAASLRDLRDSDLALRPAVAFRDLSAAVVVDSTAMASVLEETSNVYRDFASVITTTFLPPASAYTAGETIGLQALGAISDLAEHGLAILGARMLDTRGALALFERLRLAQVRMVAVWRASVLPLVKSGSKVYETAYKGAIDRVDALLAGPAPPGFVSLADALAAGSLLEAVHTQHRLNAQFTAETPHASGTLLLTYLGSLTTTITKNVPFALRYRLSGSVTPHDTIDLQAAVGAGFSVVTKNADGSLPLALEFGPGAGQKEFLVEVTALTDTAEGDMGVSVAAHSNPAGLSFFATPKHLRVGSAPPPSEESFAFTIATTNVSMVGSELRVPTSPATTANVTLRLTNNTDSDVTVDLAPDPATTTATWQIVKGPFALAAQPVPKHSHTDFIWHFKPDPATAGKTLTFTLTATNSVTTALVTQVTLLFVSI